MQSPTVVDEVDELGMAAVAFAGTALLTPAVAALARRAGLVDRAGESGLKIHQEDVPIAGGVAIVAVVAAVAILDPDGADATLLLTMALTGAIGLADDVHPLRAWLRVGLLACAGSLAALGLTDERTALTALTAVLIGIQVSATSNSANILDGQDGLAAGLAVIAALGLSRLDGGEMGDAVVLAGATAGFLVWNYPRARSFLGNNGAYALGGALAVLAARVEQKLGTRGLLASAACLGVFVFEFGSTAIRRALSAPTLSGGDRRHSYDILASRIGSRGASTTWFWLLGVACLGLSQVVARVPLAVGLSTMILGGATIVAFGAWQGLRTRNRVKT
jgi:UDP-GlcNAc:undecaprenyl-phosphate GlcNAc-1-phosphate transferase